ncbi:MAG: M28 family peptidase, partial [Candidatus Hodarchaeota archaeon]
WVPEFSGTIPWLKIYDDQRDQRKILAALNLDMVGESPKIIGSPLTINSPSCATPTYLKALLNKAARCVSEKIPIYDEAGRFYQFNYRLKPFAGGSDHLIFNDRYFSIPSVMFGHEDPFHHSSADSIDKVDPYECKSVATVAGSAAFILAASNNQFLEELLYLVFLEGVEEMINYELHLNQELTTVPQKRRKLELIERSIIQRMKSILDFQPEGEFQEKLTYFSEAISAHFSRIKNQIKPKKKDQKEKTNANIRIKRNYFGPISYKQLDKTDRSPEDKKIFQSFAKDYWGGAALELLNLADGSLTIEEIFLFLSIYYPKLELNSVLSVAKLFQDEGILIEV